LRTEFLKKVKGFGVGGEIWRFVSGRGTLARVYKNEGERDRKSGGW